MKVVNSSNFEESVIKFEGLVLVDFFAPWCGPCQGMLPVLEEISVKLPKNQQIVKINVDDDQELAGKYGIMSIPAFKLFKNGKIIDEAVGAMNKEAVLALFAKHSDTSEK